MNGTASLILGWWLHTLLGGGVLLLLAWLLMKGIAQPARRQRLAEFALAGALLLAGLSLAPSWLVLPVSWDGSPDPSGRLGRAVPREQPDAPVPPEEIAAPLVMMEIPEQLPPEAVRNAGDVIPPQPVEAPTEPARSFDGWRLVPWLLGFYAVGSALLLGRWLLGYLALARLMRSAQSAPPAVRRLCAELCGNRSLPRILVAPRVRVPFSFGLFRPTIVLPVDLTEETALRWVLSHELAHLERRDAWTCLLFALGQVVYFLLPWFWWLRRQVRLCQEYVADAVAASAGQPEDYAQLLLGWSQAPRLPVTVTGVSGSSSDLYRRITMLLQSSTPVEKRCPRSWTLLMGAGLLGLSVVVAGVGLKAVAAPAPKEEPKKEEPKKEEPKKEEPKKNTPKVPDPFDVFPDLEKRFENVPGVDPDVLKQLREEMKRTHAEMRKAMEMARQFQGGQFPGVLPQGGLPGGMVMPRLGQLGQLDRQERTHEGRLGARLDKPSDTLAEQLDLPQGQGLVVDEVRAESAAGKAGLKAHDILLEVNGKVVPSNIGEFVKQVGEIKANTAVDVVVLRKGKKETIKGLTLPEAKVEKPAARPGFGFQFPFENAFPGNVQGRIQGFGAGGKPIVIQTTRNGDEFTSTKKEGDLSIVVNGKVEDGKAVPTSIEIDAGNGAKKYESLEKVPEEHREAVKNLLRMVTGKGAQRLQQF